MPETEPEPDPLIHPQEHLEWQVDRLFEESDLAIFALLNRVADSVSQANH